MRYDHSSKPSWDGRPHGVVRPGVVFTDGQRVVCEYPHQTSGGEQMDFVEVMELHDALIQHHRVYWGWRGVGLLTNNHYYR